MSHHPHDPNGDVELQESEIWADDGHLTEVALLLLTEAKPGPLAGAVDGHLADCTSCSERVADTLLLTLEFDDPVVRAALEVAPTQAAPRRLPLFPISAALIIAALGAIPTLVEVPVEFARGIASLWSALPRLLGAALTTARVVAANDSQVLTFVWLMSALLLIFTGVLIARRAPRATTWKEA